ncbi:MAG: hypothetical protein ABSA09_00410 [Desulfobaccales bacterium]|jgi:hypothetical protein
MKKVLALASVGAFLLSLTGASLAQEKGPTAATPPAAEKEKPATTGAPAVEGPAAPKSKAKPATTGAPAMGGPAAPKSEGAKETGEGKGKAESVMEGPAARKNEAAKETRKEKRKREKSHKKPKKPEKPAEEHELTY